MYVWFNINFLNIILYIFVYFYVSFKNTIILLQGETIYIFNEFNKVIKNDSLFFNIDTYLLTINIALQCFMLYLYSIIYSSKL